jgi:uracil-DNA glycosylase family 4
MPFFEKSKKKKSSLRKRSFIAACAQCGRKNVKDKITKKIISRCYPIPVSGEGNKKILLIRDQPTESINSSGNWFVRQSSKPSFILNALRNADIEPEEDCWMTGAAVCYGNGHPLLAIESCLPTLNNTIQNLQPKVIIPIGTHATYAVMSFLWRDESTGGLARFIGQQIPAKRWNAWVCPVYDSAYILSLGYKNPKIPNIPTSTGVVAYLWLERHIEEAVKKLEEPPFPDDGSKDLIQFLYTVDDIGEALEMIGNSNKGYAAVDYETNCLKPEVTGARVLCAAVCLGGWNKICRIIAFPMLHDVIPEWKRFLQSPIPKVAHNCKFEDRWSNIFFKTPVNNWAGDTMLNTHILNCSPGITGLKFQAAVNFGVVGYEDATKPYMDSGENKLNRLHEVPLETLLKYCANDTLFTWKLFIKQMKQFGEKPYWK